MRNLAACLLAALLMSGTARADGHRPVFKIALQEGWTVAFPAGKGREWKTPTTTLAFGVGVPLVGRLGFFAEVAMDTPNTVFNPAPKGYVALNLKLSESWFIGASVAYRFGPDFGKGETHTVGTSIFPGVNISREVAFLLIVAVGKTVSPSDGPWALTIAPRVSFRLPF